MTSTAYIELANVNKRFETKRGEINALENINMHFNKGEFVSIVGPSGCGKSTIIRIIDDIIKPTSGSITVDGFTYDNAHELGREQSKKLGFVFQLPNLYPWLTVRQNVELPLTIYGLSGPEYKKRVDDLLAYAGVTDYADSYPSSVSGGMSQRIGVIRGMVHNPPILMLDEPFGALDDDTRETLDLDLLKIWKDSGATILFITHNVEEAVLMSERVYVMSPHPGRVKQEIPIDIPFERRTLDLFGDAHFAELCRVIEQLIGDLQLGQIR